MKERGSEQLTTIDIRTLQERFGVTADDLGRIAAVRDVIVANLDTLVTDFYVWLEAQPQYLEFFQDNEPMLKRVKAEQRVYWSDFFAGRVDNKYLEERRVVGMTHARIGLPLTTYLGGMNTSYTIISAILAETDQGPEERIETLGAIARLMNLDTSIVVQTFTEQTNRVIAEQSRAILEMSTPVSAVWENVLMLPAIGIIDSRRAQDIMNAILQKISETQSQTMILDISGVAMVDTAVANHLIKITKATRLMGCECTISGVSPAIAQTIVELGVDVGTIRTTSTLRDALEGALKDLGVEVSQARR